MRREELLARLEKVQGGGISEMATLFAEEIATADPDSFVAAGLAGLIHGTGTVLSFFEPSGTVNVAWKLEQGQDVTMWDAAGVGLDAVLMVAPMAASKANHARKVGWAAWKNTNASQKTYRRVMAVLDEVLPTNPLDRASQRFYQQAADRLGVDIGVRAVNPVTRAVTGVLSMFDNVRPKPAAMKEKSMAGFIRATKTETMAEQRRLGKWFFGDADLAYVRDRVTGEMWDAPRIMRELVAPTNRAIRAAGLRTRVVHGAQFSAARIFGGPLAHVDARSIGHTGGIVEMGRRAGNYINPDRARRIGLGTHRWFDEWGGARAFGHPNPSTGTSLISSPIYGLGQAAREHDDGSGK
jgi:hypothetical protein